MSKPRGCKSFTHVQCDYNRCRGRDISAGHVKDCPFQDSDEEDQDVAENSDVEDDENEWKTVRAVKLKPTPTTAWVSSIGLNDQNTLPEATKSHNPWVLKTSKVSPKTPYTTGIMDMGNPSRPGTKTPAAPLKSWARAPTPPTNVTIRPPRNDSTRQSLKSSHRDQSPTKAPAAKDSHRWI
ncbi:hypothetical protein L211DRAFT_835585 [Terfezia boudieri ATCC MYA-4762]|uniref:Uncharacterized protein n=1 Tax=Terfezia boudieri ATCC MYA-4762 TaxID=1051890 RepID=A0A3N4LTI2_9PEZI|nr:hypothetical protein L211DRAFT_835585 [Terfezia boudieri ATCC MYA-4762]